MNFQRNLKSLSDDELLRRLSDLLKHSRRIESDLVAHIGEVDERRLFAREGCSSMFIYCVEVLNLSEAEAYLRIAVARAARAHPMLLAMLGDGRLHLSGIAKLAPHLSEGNRDTFLARAAHKSKRQIEELVAEISPKPDVPDRIRKLPERKPGPTSSPASELRPDGVAPRPPDTPPPTHEVAPAPQPGPPLAPSLPPASRGNAEPLSANRYKIAFTASAELYDKLRRLRALMRAQVPDGDLAALIEDAVTEKLDRLESKRYGQTKTPRKNIERTDTTPSTRHVPAAVRRAVYARDRGQCTFVDLRGKRCKARDGLELHHVKPFGRGGDHSVANVRLTCPAHNAYFAERDYGKGVMERYRRSGNQAREPAPVYWIIEGLRPGYGHTGFPEHVSSSA